jgi:hypothetical protein
LYFCDLNVFTDGDYAYSDVSLSSSYEAAKAAWNKAQSAQDSVDNLEIGARVFDDTENNVLGYVTDVQTGKGYHYDVDKSGQTVALFPDDSSSVTVTARAHGTLDPNGLLIGGTRYAIGHTFVVYIGDCKLYLRISGLEPAA